MNIVRIESRAIAIVGAVILILTSTASGKSPSQGQHDVAGEGPKISLGGILSAIVSERGTVVTEGIAYGPNPRQQLDVYRPVGKAEHRAIAIFYYGGAWTAGDRATYRFVGAALATRGITTVVADYRLFPEVSFPTFVEDAARAYAWVANNVASNPSGGKGRDQRPIFVIGHSAGAHIAALLALDRSYLASISPTPPPPAGFVGLAGPYAFDPTTWPSTKAIFAVAAGTPDRARPIAYSRPHAPPALLIHGLDDNTVKLWNTRNMKQALQDQGNYVEELELSSVGHIGLITAIARPLRWRAPVLEKIVNFIEHQSSKTGPPSNH